LKRGSAFTVVAMHARRALLRVPARARTAAIAPARQLAPIGRRRGAFFSSATPVETKKGNAHDHLDYDLVVVGGGSGGVAAADEAARWGARVALLDWVDPSPAGTSWGVGGTCVNVGCIPKKLMVYAARVGASAMSAEKYGWEQRAVAAGTAVGSEDAEALCDVPFAPQWQSRWSALSSRVQQHVRSLNFGIQGGMIDSGIHFYPAKGSLAGTVEPGAPTAGHRIALDYGRDFSAEPVFDFLGGGAAAAAKPGEGGDRASPDAHPGEITARHVLFSVGGRPRPLAPLEDHGAARCLTSDDLFWRKDLFQRAEAENRPVKVIVVGGGYIALECAGFLRGLGHTVVLINRSDVFLRGFERDASQRIVEDLRSRGVTVLTHADVMAVGEGGSGGDHLVSISQGRENQIELEEEADLVLLAVGRETGPQVSAALGAEAGLVVRGGKFLTNELSEVQTDDGDSSNIFAIGDCAFDGEHARIELTPVAVKQGRSLSARLFCSSLLDEREVPSLDPGLVPSTVFTPLEYSFCGMTEEEAVEYYGVDEVDVLHSAFDPLDEKFRLVFLFVFFLLCFRSNIWFVPLTQ
jgi:thioredoxin reductase (NADPH)